jgi:hypothetical protein
MAVKTAESDALKRAAINLGTQFGLSLYDNGSRNDVVGHSLVKPVSDDSYDDNDEVTGWSPLTDAKSEILRSAIKAMQTEQDLRNMWMQLEREGLLDVTLFGGDNTAREAILGCLADVRGESYEG